MSTAAERVEFIRNQADMNWSDLARFIGLTTQQTFSDIRKGKHGISTKLANRIADKFPNLRREWIMFGTEPIYVQGASSLTGETSFIPDGYLPVLNSKDSVGLATIFPKAEAMMRNEYNGMQEYSIGMLLAIRPIQDVTNLLYGSDYLIETADFTLLRKVQSGSTPDSYALCATSTEAYSDGRKLYEPVEIVKSKILRAYAICGSVSPQQ